MDNQEFRINKTGINLTVKSKISVLGISEISHKEIVCIESFFRSNLQSKELLKKFDLNYYYFRESSAEDDFFISKKNISINNRKRKTKKETVWSAQIYLSFIRNLSPIIPSKGYTFILKIYMFLKKFSFSHRYQGFEILSRHLETLIRLSEALGKLLLSAKIQEFHIKAAGRIIFKSMYLLEPSEYGPLNNKYSIEKNFAFLLQKI